MAFVTNETMKKHENRIASCVSPRHAANPHVNTQIRCLVYRRRFQ